MTRPDIVETTARNLQFESEVVAIHRALGEIPHAFVKGVLLAEGLYDQIGERPMVDIDLVVPIGMLSDALDALSAFGFERMAPFRALDHPQQAREAPLVRRLNDDSEIVLDLHWHLLDPFMFDLDEREVWAHLQTATVLGQPVPTTDATLTALHLAIHHLQHRCLEAHIADDLRRHVNKVHDSIDWPELWRLAAIAGATHVVAFALLHAEAPTQTVVRDLRARLVHRLVGPRAGHTRRWDVSGMAMQLALLSPRQVLTRVRWGIAPPKFVVGTVLGIPTDQVRFRHYVLRLVRRDRAVPLHAN